MLALDVDKDGKLDYSEVLETRINRKLVSNEARLRKLFDELDLNKSGDLDAQELRAALNHVEGKDYSEAEVKRKMEEADSNVDGVINYEEFLSMWVSDKKRQNPTGLTEC